MSKGTEKDDANVKDHDKDKKTITIIVNGREKTVEEKELSFDDLVHLAFENPPTGELICFTITYHKGHGNKPTGTLNEGESVKLKKGMVFNVTATDKS
ncbi:MAG: multiubiquitin domain-containing protein [Kiloniellaceae bacterium]